MFATFIVGVVSIMALFLFGTAGEIITEKSGHLNMGTPGIMCMGATGAAVGAKLYITTLGGAEYVANANGFLAILIPVLFALLFAGLTGLLYCFLVDTLQCNQNVTGLIITTLGAGVYPFVTTITKNAGFGHLSRTYYQHLFPSEFYESNWFTQILFSYGFLVYLSIIIAVVAYFVIKKTRIGLSLRAIGENPGTSDASGINVTRYKYLATLIGSCISGLGGLYYLLSYNSGSLEYNLEALGWIAVALVIFSLWNTGIGILGSFIFAVFYMLPNLLNVSGAVSNIVSTLPYFVTVIVLIIISLFNKRETQPPAALGLPYYREDR